MRKSISISIRFTVSMTNLHIPLYLQSTSNVLQHIPTFTYAAFLIAQPFTWTQTQHLLFGHTYMILKNLNIK
jgi:hypothetical protein